MAARIKKGDRVVVLTGKSKGHIGEVVRVLKDEDRVIVRGANMVMRHQRQSMQDQGGIVPKEAPLHMSNVSHVDPKEDKPTRIGFKKLENGRKVRFAKRSGEVIDV